MLNPLVSICCITFNHVSYIHDAIEGFLMQKTSFPIEIIIHDDASTDGTTEIIQEYANKYPELFVTLLQNENQWSKGEGSIYARFVYPLAQGKYIALCEGDDYWTDPLKLQKQVDFLENNKDTILCVGGFRKYNTYTKEYEDIIKVPRGILEINKGYTFTLNDTKKAWITKTLTAVFRNDQELIQKLTIYKYGRDINLFYHLLSCGKGFYLTEILGTYNIHSGGVNSMKQGEININAAYRVYKELFVINKDNWTREMYYRHTMGLFTYELFNSSAINNLSRNMLLLIESIKLIRSLKEFRILIAAFISPSIKMKSKAIFAWLLNNKSSIA